LESYFFLYWYMKNILSALFVLLLVAKSIAQQPEFLQTIEVCNSSVFGGLRPRITLVHDSIPVISFNRAGADPAVFVSRYSGGAFSAPLRISSPGTLPLSSTVNSAEIKSAGDTVFLLYAEHTAEASISIRRSLDGGLSFPDSFCVASYPSNHVEFPELTLLSGGNPVVAYIFSDLNMINTEIRAAYSTNGGAVFTSSTGITGLLPGQPCECCPIAVEKAGNSVFIGYRNNISNEREFYLLQSNDGAQSFTGFVAIDDYEWIINTCPTNGIDLLPMGDSLHTAFASKPGGTVQIFHRGVHHTGTNIGTVGLNENSPPAQNMSYSVLAGANDTLFLAWQDTRSGSTDVYFSFRTPGQSGFSQAFAANDPVAGVQRTIDMAYANGLLHIVYTDLTNQKVIYRKARLTNTTSAEEIPGPNFQLTYINQEQSIRISNDKERIKNVLIYTISGSVSQEIKGNNQQEINISTKELIPGIYLAKLLTESGREVVLKFVLTQP